MDYELFYRNNPHVLLGKTCAKPFCQRLRLKEDIIKISYKQMRRVSCNNQIIQNIYEAV